MIDRPQRAVKVLYATRELTLTQTSDSQIESERVFSERETRESADERAVASGETLGKLSAQQSKFGF